jgi:hypothetical protein
MAETLEKIQEQTLDAFLTYIFTGAKNKSQPIEFVYEFSSGGVGRFVEKECATFGIDFTSVPDKKTPFVKHIIVEDPMRTKFFIVSRCAKRARKYKDMGKEVDFPLHGYEWKPEQVREVHEMTLCQNIFLKTYGELNL